ncbi:hypothetical protein IJO12_04850 [bacterium]|nr:hypothetical protein [bacterium]
MYDELLRMQIILELKNLVENIEKFEDYKDSYTEFMKEMILNTYSVN